MGRLLILLLVIAALVLIWKAFGPGSWRRNQPTERQQEPRIKGPDDDDEFLWRLQKEQFKRRRAEEAHRREERERDPRPPDEGGEPDDGEGPAR